MRTIFADVLFIINFCLDFLILLAAGKILHFKLALRKLLLSSALGAVYAVTVTVLSQDGLLFLVLHIAMSMLMCYIAYDFTSALGYIKLLILFYSISLLFGGGISALHHFISSVWFSFGGARRGLSPVLLISISGMVFLLSMAGGRIFAKSASVSKVKAQIFFADKSQTVTLLCDSGNLLRDPYSSLPVIIVKENKLSGLLSETGEPLNLFDLIKPENKERALRLKLRFIPISTPNGSSLIPGFHPDRFVLFHRNKRIALDAVVAADNSPSDYGGNDGIIPSLFIDML